MLKQGINQEVMAQTGEQAGCASAQQTGVKCVGHPRENATVSTHVQKHLAWLCPGHWDPTEYVHVGEEKENIP